MVKDVCNCCPVCAKQEGDRCGGAWGAAGKCDQALGLFCEENKGRMKPGTCKYSKYFKIKIDVPFYSKYFEIGLSSWRTSLNNFSMRLQKYMRQDTYSASQNN